MEEARCLLARVGIAVTDDRLNAARRIMCEARPAAAGSYSDPAIVNAAATVATIAAMARNATQGDSPADAASPAETLSTPIPSADHAQVTVAPTDAGRALTEEQERFALMTPVAVVDEYMRIKPKAGERQAQSVQIILDNPAATKRRKSKSQPKVWGDSQRRQFRAAAWLFGKSNEGRPLSAISQDDLNDFYDRLNRLPSSHHKSPRHEPMSLESICEEAQAKIAMVQQAHLRSVWMSAQSIGTLPI